MILHTFNLVSSMLLLGASFPADIYMCKISFYTLGCFARKHNNNQIIACTSFCFCFLLKPS